MRADGLRSQTGIIIGPASATGRRPSWCRIEQGVGNRITYICTHEGWLYLSMVLDLFSRQVIGWPMQSRIDRELAINALLMAVWRREPKQEVIAHSNQGRQFSSYGWQDFLKAHNVVGSMSRRGNYYENAIAESFFQLLKRERIKRTTYIDREGARQDVCDYIEMFYNPTGRHGYNNRLSHMEFKRLKSF